PGTRWTQRGGRPETPGPDRKAHHRLVQGPQAVRQPVPEHPRAEVTPPAIHQLPSLAARAVSISPDSPFGSELRARRSELNARYALARQTSPDLESGAFGAFLEAAVAPVVDSVANIQSVRVPDVTSAAFDAALELAMHRRLGGSEMER